MVQLLGISGSLRPQSFSSQLLSLFFDALSSRGVQCEILDLSTLHLPFCNGGREYPDHPDVQILREKISQCDGLLLVTPEYHGSVSGVMKNCLDLVSFEEMEGKLVALASALGGQSSFNALNHLRLICRHLHAWVLPHQFCLAEAWNALDELGQLKDQKVAEHFQLMVDHFLLAAEKHSA